MIVRRWTRADRVWFAMSELAPTVTGAVERLGYRGFGDWWGREYPADSAHLDRAWRTFRAQGERMVRQAAGQEPVPWREALRALCTRTAGSGVRWWLVGIAALAVRGVDVRPGDLDVVCSAEDAHRLGDLLADELIEPVAATLNEEGDWIGERWGRAFVGARVEWLGGVYPAVDRPLVSDFGPVALSRSERVEWEDWPVWVPPVAMQRAVSVRRGLHSRVAAIDAFTSKGSLPR